MRYGPLLVIVLTAGCSEPLHDATEPGARLIEWKHVAEVTNEVEFSTLSLTTSSGVKLRIEGSRAVSSGKQVPTRIVVTVEENPVSAEVSIACRAASQFDGDPIDVLAVTCMLAELSGTESFLGSKESRQEVSTLQVRGDGSMSLD